MNYPERLFMFFNHVNDNGRVMYTGSADKMGDDVEYIRSDIVKERDWELATGVCEMARKTYELRKEIRHLRMELIALKAAN